MGWSLFKPTKKFDGVEYWLHDLYPNAKIANAVANSIRADGLSARVVECMEGYKVYRTDKAEVQMPPPEQQQNQG